VAQAAAVVSQLAGRAGAVAVHACRCEQGWDAYRPPHVGEVRLCADAQGVITGYHYEGWRRDWSLARRRRAAELARTPPAEHGQVAAVQGVNPLVCGGLYAVAHAQAGQPPAQWPEVFQSRLAALRRWTCRLRLCLNRPWTSWPCNWGWTRWRCGSATSAMRAGAACWMP
jgi:hypothetical protein